MGMCLYGDPAGELGLLRVKRYLHRSASGQLLEMRGPVPPLSSASEQEPTEKEEDTTETFSTALAQFTSLENSFYVYLGAYDFSSQ